jgi:thiosulfate dehydrogenase [quinone] large subunit
MRAERITLADDRAVAYLLVRLTIGASLLGHGLVRLPKLAAFHAQLMGEFKASILPGVLVSACGYALPFAELVTGVLLLAGALTRAAAVAGALVMIVLVFGATSIEHFNVIVNNLSTRSFSPPWLPSEATTTIPSTTCWPAAGHRASGWAAKRQSS